MLFLGCVWVLSMHMICVSDVSCVTQMLRLWLPLSPVPLLPSGASSTSDRGSSRTIPPGSTTVPYNAATRHDSYVHLTSSAERGSDAMAMVLSSE